MLAVFDRSAILSGEAAQRGAPGSVPARKCTVIRLSPEVWEFGAKLLHRGLPNQ